MPGQFEGKVAFITGAASGIGREAALKFAQGGARVAVADISAAGGQETVAAVAKIGGTAKFFPCDVSDPKQAQAAVEGAVREFGRLDCAFNNAGIFGPRARVFEYSDEDFDRVLRIHLYGVFYCLKHELIAMRRTGGGAIVNTSSVAGLLASPATCGYAAAKHGISGLTKSAALDSAVDKIRVNAIAPGIIDTPMTQVAIGDVAARAALVHASGRAGTPQEVANVVIWLCSDAASLVTGVTLPVDDGWTVTM
jgi:NAD(P)-dependent dehydrogenase (short-subunit alcohol dehydrogenase family)